MSVRLRCPSRSRASRAAIAAVDVVCAIATLGSAACGGLVGDDAARSGVPSFGDGACGGAVACDASNGDGAGDAPAADAHVETAVERADVGGGESWIVSPADATLYFGDATTSDAGLSDAAARAAFESTRPDGNADRPIR